jgi:predicted nucleotidyltransferase
VIVPEFVLGSVARGVVHPADCPVTVVPPVPETAPGCSDGKPS